MAQQTDLTNCDREPIHIPGKIQSHGVLIAFDSIANRVMHVSANVAAFFPATPPELFGLSFADAMTRLQVDTPLMSLPKFSAMPEQDSPESSIVTAKAGGKRYHFIIHANADLALLELEPVNEADSENEEDMVGSMLNRILGAKTLAETLEYSVKQVRKIIGYDRVMIYRFAADGHGEVVAEDVDENREPFLGLHYPASDIPVQARELYKKIWFGSLPT